MALPASNATVCVVLPAYNESEHVGDVISGLPTWVDHVVVVDDCSTDDTGEVVAALRDARVTLVRHEKNTGVGGAMVTGYKTGLELGYDVLVKMDADGQMHPRDLVNVVTPVATGIAEYAKGNRFYVINANRNMPQIRKLGSVILTFMTKMSSGYWHIFDSQCGYTAVRAKILRTVDLDAIATDYFFENDMLIWLNVVGARTVDVPVATLYGSEISDVQIGRIMLSFPPRLVRGWGFRVTRKYLLMDFGAIGALGVFGTLAALFGTLFGAYRLLLANMTGIPNAIGTVMLAVLPLTVGIQSILQSFAMEVAESPGSKESRDYALHLIDSGDIG
jgi:glycosyltransferase involved in cell wall biosynthesis